MDHTNSPDHPNIAIILNMGTHTKINGEESWYSFMANDGRTKISAGHRLILQVCCCSHNVLNG